MNGSPASAPDPLRTAGWSSEFPEFRGAATRVVQLSLEEFVEGATAEQRDAWRDTIPRLQTEVGEVLDAEQRAARYTAILEYRLPLDSRRPDAVFLVAGAVIVVELKGKSQPSQADLDQTAAYARDLRAYHRECHSRAVHAVLVPSASKESPQLRGDVWTTGPRAVDALVRQLALDATHEPTTAKAFLDPDAYRPLPTLIQAARELFHSGDVRQVWRARAATEPAVEYIASVAREAARTKTRHLVLVTGVPGSGKTLVGMRAVHAHLLDDLAVARADGKPAAPALFLSGNDPLVKVLQHVLRGAGGGGKAFVRHIKDYLDGYVAHEKRVPPEHLFVFDEAQRAFSADMVREKHAKWRDELVASEPELFLRLCERTPEWSVMVALLGTGQEIHVGEEGGLALWCDALSRCAEPARWTVHAPADLEPAFLSANIATRWQPALNLDTELRFHFTSSLHTLVGRLLDEHTLAHGVSLAAEAPPTTNVSAGLRLWATRDLECAKSYLRERYAEQPDARFGLLASSRDKLLIEHGIENSFNATKNIRVGPWFADPRESAHSCCQLEICITEFQAQGLELDMALLAWGSDLRRENGAWSTELARRYRTGDVALRDPRQLRLNAYRVLLTRGRDGTIVFVPPDALLDETWSHLLASGFSALA